MVRCDIYGRPDFQIPKTNDVLIVWTILDTRKRVGGMNNMKKYTQEEFDHLPVNVHGIKECPQGDYTQIKDFSEWCSFDKGCSFGEWCSFGEGCKAISPFWSFVYEPPFKIIGKILPPKTTRLYWEERLNIKLDGCYNEIEKQIKPLLPKILKRTDLTRCERRILESWLK